MLVPEPFFRLERYVSKITKCTKRFFRSPRASDDQSYVDFLISLAKKERIYRDRWVIFPNSDEIFYVLSKYKNILEEFYRIPTPDWEVIQNIYIKVKIKAFQVNNKEELVKTFQQHMIFINLPFNFSR